MTGGEHDRLFNPCIKLRTSNKSIIDP